MSSRSEAPSVRPAFLVSFGVALCALAVAATAQVSTDQVVIGGPGATGGQGSVADTPTLTGACPASGVIDFTYDQSAHVLTLAVQNTSQVIPGVSNPVITRVWFNLPQYAISSITLLTQTGASGTPTFSRSADYNRDNGTSINTNAFGGFGVRLANQSGNPHGGIANPLADTYPAPLGDLVVGPATFTFLVAGNGINWITANSFASSLSTGVADTANAAFQFEGGGVNACETGIIGNDEECSAGGWMVGTPRIGSTVSFVMTGAPGCFGCLIASVSPGPTTMYGHTVNIGTPYIALVSTGFPSGFPSYSLGASYQIPPNPALVGITVYCAVVEADLATLQSFSVSDSFSFTVLPAP
jgi:hypothetical protein